MKENLSSLPSAKSRVPVLTEAEAPVQKNPSAIFILSPPRSGSTLLRVMLGGHPLLFAPPELELLSFNTMAERKAALGGRYRDWLEGTIRAVMALKGCELEEAKRTLEDWESQGLTTAQCYGLMQDWMGERTLVDKTTSYSLDLETLKRAEAVFDRPLYVHLLRDPRDVVRSFEEAKLDQVFFRYDHPFSRRELAELVWLVSHQNILEFLKGVPADRQHQLKFEELVNGPGPAAEGLCRFLGLELHPEMLQPYGDRETRMTDGIHPLSKMLGDPTFHQHQAIDAKVAGRWREDNIEDFLGDITWQVAESLGYESPARPSRKADGDGDASPRKALPPIQPVTRRGKNAAPEHLLADLDQLSEEELDSLLVEAMDDGEETL